MTTDVRGLVAAANQHLPAGWGLVASEARRFKYRSLWRIAAVHEGQERLVWSLYRVAAALPAVIERINAEAVTESTRVVVTTDGDGYVRDIEETAA